MSEAYRPIILPDIFYRIIVGRIIDYFQMIHKGKETVVMKLFVLNEL
jgi:hypothetical protein